MVAGLNTNVKYRGKVFHVQTEDLQRRSLIQTIVFHEGSAVASTDSPYADLTRSDSHGDQELGGRLKAQHWRLVIRLREGRMLFSLGEKSPVPIQIPKNDSVVVEPAVAPLKKNAVVRRLVDPVFAIQGPNP